MTPPDRHLPDADGPGEAQSESYPLGFTITVALTAAYLLYRLGQGLVWLVSRLGA